MNKLIHNNFIMMLLGIILFVGGYIFLRFAYNVSDKMPFTQEIILVILGTLATILITAILLNKQSSVELEKEQSIKFIELKSETYRELIALLESIVLKKDIAQKELTQLQFQTHRLAIFASPSVLEEYKNFLTVFHEHIAKDKHVSIHDADLLSEALAKLTVFIRADLVGELDARSSRSASQIREQILSNATRH